MPLSTLEFSPDSHREQISDLFNLLQKIISDLDGSVKSKIVNPKSKIILPAYLLYKKTFLPIYPPVWERIYSKTLFVFPGTS